PNAWHIFQSPYMPPKKRRRSRPEATHESAHLHLDTINQTSLAFLGVQRRAWMTTTGSAVPVVARPKSCTQSRHQNPSPVISCAPVASTLPGGSTVFPSPVNSSVSSPEASTSGPGAAGSPSTAHAPPPQSPLSTSANLVPASQAPSPPLFDSPSARLPGDADAPTAPVEGFQPASQTADACRVLTISAPIASGSENLLASRSTCVSNQSNASSPARSPASPENDSASVIGPTQQNMAATGKYPALDNEPASTLAPTQLNVPSAAISLITPPRESTSATMSTHSNGPFAAPSSIAPRHEPNPCPVIYRQDETSTAGNRTTYSNEPTPSHVSTQQNPTSSTENHLARFSRSAPHHLPVSSNAPPAVTNQPRPHNRPATIQGTLSNEVPDRQQKRHCSDTSRHPAASSSVPRNFGINFEQLRWIVKNRLPKSEVVDSQDHHIVFYKMLDLACSKGDLFYLVFHQAFCLWSLNNSYAHAFLSASPQVVDHAFHLLLRVWRQNSELPMHHLQWFAAFPVFLNSSAYRGNLLSRDQVSCITPLVHSFLAKLVLNQDLIPLQVPQRGFPLMAWELRHALQCPSPVLRWVLFTCSRRYLGIRDDSEAQKLLSHLFEVDSRSEYSHPAETAESIRVRMQMMHSYIAVTQGATANSLNNMSVVNHTQLPMQHHLGMQNAHSAPQHFLQPLASSQSTYPLPNASTATFAPQNTGSHPMATYSPVMDGNVNFGVTDERANAGQMHMGLNQPHLAPFSFAGSSSPAIGGQRAQVFTPPVPSNGSFPQASPYVAQSRIAACSNQVPSMPAVQNPMSLLQNNVAQRTLQATIPPPHNSGYSHPQQRQVFHQAPPRETSLSHNHVSYVAHPRPDPLQAVTPGRTGLRAPPTEPSQHQVVPLNENEIPRDDWSRAQNALHLSYLRSPERTCVMPAGKYLYQFVSGFAAVPQALPPQTGLRALRFSVSQLQVSKLVVADAASEVPAKALFSNGSLRYRLRMCKQKQSTLTVEESTWTGCLSFWPPHIFLACNEQHVQPRRRQQFGSDLPIELTGLLKSGENTVQVSLPGVERNIDHRWTYFMAVEVISILDHDAVRAMVQANSRTSVDEFKRDVKRRLKSDGSDDIIAESNHICVSVADPFSSCLFTTPVRGANCKHLECFDLEIWLRTRPARNSREPSAVDCWKCPICDVDARPVSLHIDDFFTEIRAKLVKDGDDSVKKVTIHSDGTWSPLLEADEPQDEARLPTAPVSRERLVGAQAAILGPLQDVIVIEDD
ncbi:hypothetical protein CP533_5141, partial [Ophiocordyceps camponoti-saundersi (nom. inval.)]